MMMEPLPLWRATTAISAASLVAAVISFFALFVVTAPGGCAPGLGFVIMLGLGIAFAAVWVVLAVLAGTGAFLSYRGSRVGPYFAAAANLPVIAFFGWWDPVHPGQLVWGWIVVAFAVLPLLALLLVAVQLVAGGSRGHVAGAFVTLMVGALLLPYLIGHGWALDLGYAYQSPTPVQNTSSC